MTRREEAIKTLKENYCAMCAYGSQDMDSCDICSCDNKDAIKTLEQEPCEDCIRRSDIGLTDFEIVMCNGDYKEALKMLLDKIEKAPSVTPAEKVGRWIAQDFYNCHTDFRCSECGYIHSFMHLYGKPTADYTYCPNCGAKMREVEG